MKKTLFLALALSGALPVMADSGLTLSGEGIANNCTWNLYATFDNLAVTDTFTTLATVNLVNNNTSWDAVYAVGYTYSADNTLTLGMASFANPNSWNIIRIESVDAATSPISFALSHNGSNEGGDNKLSFHLATGKTTSDIILHGAVSSSAADGYSNTDISSVTLGTDSTATRIFNKSFVLTPATNGINIVDARLEHSAYSDAAFKEFILEEQPWADDETVRYTTAESGNQKNVYAYGTENGEVTFNPDKFDADNKLKLDKTIDLTARTTFIVADDKTVEISGASSFTGADGKTHEKGSAFGGGELVKSGGGTLTIRLNDTNRDIDVSVPNDYEGSVTVEEGTLFLLHSDVNPSAYKARLGGGEDTVITVKEGAVLEMGAQTEISIPLGAHASSEAFAHNVVIEGGPVQVPANATYGIPSLRTETSTIKDVVINREGLDQVDKEVRAQLVVAGITVFDARVGDSVAFKHADIITDAFHYNGDTVLRNTTLYADNQFVASSLSSDSRFTLQVVDGSYVVYGAASDGDADEPTWGHVDNVYVDKSSRLQTSANQLEHDWGGALQIQGLCTLDIEDIMLRQGGLAARADGTVQAKLDGKPLTLTDIQYKTDQLSGDMLVKYDGDIHGTLDLHLKDAASALPDGKTLKNTVFTLTLTNFDSSLLVVDEFGNLDPSAAKLTIDAFADTQWHLVYGRYDAETNNSIFTFSTMEHLVIPEPATATLSLLALAALAARRRRR